MVQLGYGWRLCSSTSSYRWRRIWVKGTVTVLCQTARRRGKNKRRLCSSFEEEVRNKGEHLEYVHSLWSVTHETLIESGASHGRAIDFGLSSPTRRSARIRSPYNLYRPEYYSTSLCNVGCRVPPPMPRYLEGIRSNSTHRRQSQSASRRQLDAYERTTQT